MLEFSNAILNMKRLKKYDCLKSRNEKFVTLLDAQQNESGNVFFSQGNF